MKITTQILWQGAVLFALIDAAFIPLLVRLVKPDRFCRLERLLVLIAGIFWCLLWAWVVAYFWDSVYGYFFPDWSRWLLPVFQGSLSAGVAFLIWRLARRFGERSVLHFCLLGGLWGLLTHIWAVSRGLLLKAPMLQGANPAAAVIIAFFEFTFYWCIVLSAASLVDLWTLNPNKPSPA